jgi:putative transcriptional regulator
VLLVHHDDQQGSLGFIVNRPTDVKLSDILEDLEVAWDSQQTAPPAFFGGPVKSEIGTLLFLERQSESERQICPDVVASQNVSDLETLSSRPPNSFRLYLGYAGWADGQLEQEILRNDWLIAPVSTDLIFAGKPEDVWRNALASVGVDPENLPLWTQSHQGEPAAN